MPVAATRPETISDTASPDNRSATRPCRSAGRKTGPARKLQASGRGARTGQWRVRPKGCRSYARAFLVALREPEREDEPLPHALDVVAIEPTTSERRNPPAKPMRSSARSRTSERQGLGSPLASWALEIVAMQRMSVATYEAASAGSAGIGPSHAAKWARSDR
jgi:hypothetical protein